MHVGTEQPLQVLLDVFESGWTAGRKHRHDERKIWNRGRPFWILFRIPDGQFRFFYCATGSMENEGRLEFRLYKRLKATEDCSVAFIPKCLRINSRIPA